VVIVVHSALMLLLCVECCSCVRVCVEVSADGSVMLLLLSTRDTYVAVINLRTNKLLHELPVTGCYAVLLSPTSDYICTSSVNDSVSLVSMFVFSLSLDNDTIHDVHMASSELVNSVEDACMLNGVLTTTYYN